VIGAARIAVDMYLGVSEHEAHLVDAMWTYRAFIGEESAFAYDDEDFGGEFSHIDNSWQFDPGAGRKLGVNPVGAQIPPVTGEDVDGSLPEEMRRLGELDCTACGLNPSLPCYNRADKYDSGLPPGMAATNYVWEALQGLVMQAYLLHRCGFDAFGWADEAIERTHRFLYVTYGFRAQDTWDDVAEVDNPACCNASGERNEADDSWVPHIVRAIYDPGYLDQELVFGGRPGKNCGFADWWTIGMEPVPELSPR